MHVWHAIYVFYDINEKTNFIQQYKSFRVEDDIFILKMHKDDNYHPKKKKQKKQVGRYMSVLNYAF